MRSYGIGYGTRLSDDAQLYQDKTVAPGGVTQNTVTVTANINSIGNDFTSRWYLLVKSGMATGKLYNISSVDVGGTSRIITCSDADFVSGGLADGDDIRLFKVDAFTFEKSIGNLITGSGQIQPAISITKPVTSETTSVISYDIKWLPTYSTGASARVSLYYDLDNTGYDGLLIAGNIAPTGSGAVQTTSWNISGMPTGDYYIYAVLNDGVS